MPHPIVSTVTLGAANAAAVAAAQIISGPGLTMTLTANPVVLDAPRRIVIASAGNDSTRTFTVTGTARPEQGGATQVEKVKGASAGSVITQQDFASVSSITVDSATVANVTVGTTSTGSGPWVPWDMFPAIFLVGLQATVLAGAPTFTVEVTEDDVFGTWLPPGVPYPRAVPWAGMVGATGSVTGSITTPVRASRLTLTVVGSVQLVQQQQGV